MVYHVIFNPAAKNGKSGEICRRVCEGLKAAGREYVLHETERRGHAEELAAALPEDAEELIVIGGDGTFHEVLNGLRDPKRLRMALIPAGTGNDFCVGAKIPFDPGVTLSLLLAGKSRETDFISFGERRCMNVGGLGMDVDVLERCARGRLRGKIKYLWSLVVSVCTFRGYDVRVRVGGEELVRKALFVAVCNGDRIGGGIRICPDADVGDGKLEVVIVPQMGFFGMIRAFVALMRGKILQFSATEHYYCDEVEAVPDRPRTVQMDGELYGGYAALRGRIERGLRIYR